MLAKKYELLPTQISLWKSEAVNNITAVFSLEKTAFTEIYYLRELKYNYTKRPNIPGRFFILHYLKIPFLHFHPHQF